MNFQGVVKHVRSNIIGYLALFVALGGTSYAVSDRAATTASTATSGNQIYACVTNQFKTLNLSSKSAPCPDGQRKISWNQKGVRGAPGAKGA